jgi:hypothetical protein
VNVYISRLLRVVRNTIFRKAPPSVVSGYGKRSINLNKVVATFDLFLCWFSERFTREFIRGNVRGVLFGDFLERVGDSCNNAVPVNVT